MLREVTAEKMAGAEAAPTHKPAAVEVAETSDTTAEQQQQQQEQGDMAEPEHAEMERMKARMESL